MPELLESLTKDLTAHQPSCRRGEGFADTIERTDDGLIRGRAVPLSKWVQLAPKLFERYEPGTFARQVKDPARVKLCLEHGQVVGKVDMLEERADGLYFEGRISASDDIPEARKARAMLADDLADELSVGWQSMVGGTDIETRADGTTTWRHRRARLMEISLVPWGAMGRDATVTRAAFVDFDEHADERAAALLSRRAAEREWFRRWRAHAYDAGQNVPTGI